MSMESENYFTHTGFPLYSVFLVFSSTPPYPQQWRLFCRVFSLQSEPGTVTPGSLDSQAGW